MHQKHLARRQIREQIFRAAAEAGHGLAFEALHEVLRKRETEIGPPRLDLDEPRALHRGHEPAANGFYFGKFGHFNLSRLNSRR